MTLNYVPEAFSVLKTIEDHEFPDRARHLHPYTMLTALMIHAPTETAKQEIAKDIIDNTADGDILAGLTSLTDYWWTTLLVPLRAQGGRTQPPSDHPSRPLDFQQRMVAGRLNTREKALRRCGFRCPVTGFFDRVMPNRPRGTVPYTLEGAHIIPYHLSQARNGIEREQKNKIWQALGQFAGPDLCEELEGQKIDALGNIIILEHNCHVEFGRLNLWFTPDESNPNRYRVNYVIDGERTNGVQIIPGAVRSGDYVEFIHNVPEYLPVSRELLGVHAAIAEVIHMIGGGEAIDNILWEWERIMYLSEDGADADLLEARLNLIMAI